MFIRSIFLFFLLWFTTFLSSAAPSSARELTAVERADTLLARMTLTEKIGQLNQLSKVSPGDEALLRAGGIGSFLNLQGAAETNGIQKIAVEESRLHIPLLLGSDVIHGYRTIFPIPLAEACSWNPELARKTAAAAAAEARAVGINWTFAPMVDVSRDPRWGRIAEGSGEDTFLGSALSAARVHGFQGDDLTAPASVLACLKHYVGYGNAQAGREYHSADMSERTLRETYLPPFKAGVDAGAMSIMSAFNALNGIPASANRFTLTDILRNEWGFRGLVVSDWTSIPELINHGLAADSADAAAKALVAGVDMDMVGKAYANDMERLVREGVVPESVVNEAARRILTVKFAMGLFEHPYTDPALESKVILSPEKIALAREAARESIVLLKNDREVLPLKKDLRSIAVVGPLAADRGGVLGTWSAQGKGDDVVSVLEGIKSAVSPKTKVITAPGCGVTDADTKGFGAAVNAAKQAEMVVAVVGEYGGMSGEANSRADIGIPGVQEDLLRALRATGKPLVVVLMAGRPLAVPWTAENAAALLMAWHLGIQTGNALADILFGEVNPSGKLSATFPRAAGQIPIFYNEENTGRPISEAKTSSKYIDMPNTPLFPFGYGLSYTMFAYSGLKVAPEVIGPWGMVTVTANIRNTGKRAGDEVVQCYLRDEVASVVRPVRELCGFNRIHLEPGETREVQFTLGPEALGFYTADMHFTVEPGTFRVWVAPNSTEGIEGRFAVK